MYEGRRYTKIFSLIKLNFLNNKWVCLAREKNVIATVIYLILLERNDILEPGSLFLLNIINFKSKMPLNLTPEGNISFFILNINLFTEIL
jgi:hypothetical protein